MRFLFKRGRYLSVVAWSVCAILAVAACDDVEDANAQATDSRNVESVESVEGEEIAVAYVSSDRAALTGQWTVSEIVGGSVPDGGKLTLEITNDALSGYGHCNFFNSGLAFTDGGIIIGPIETSGQMCSAEDMEAEGFYFNNLERISRFEIEANGDLVLYEYDIAKVRAQRSAAR